MCIFIFYVHAKVSHKSQPTINLFFLAKENEKLRVNQCSMGSKYERNGTYAVDKELPFNRNGGGIEAFAESLQAGIHHKKKTRYSLVFRNIDH